MKKIYNWFLKKLRERKLNKRYKQKLEELRKKDPYIYRH